MPGKEWWTDPITEIKHAYIWYTNKYILILIHIHISQKSKELKKCNILSKYINTQRECDSVISVENGGILLITKQMQSATVFNIEEIKFLLIIFYYQQNLNIHCEKNGFAN